MSRCCSVKPVGPDPLWMALLATVNKIESCDQIEAFNMGGEQ